MAQRKRIMILEGNRLLADGMRSLLADRDSLELVSVILGQNGDIDQIVDFEPDVILIDESVVTNHIDVYLILTKNYRQFRTIILHQDENQLDVCDRQVVEIRTFDDFLDLL